MCSGAPARGFFVLGAELVLIAVIARWIQLKRHLIKASTQKSSIRLNPFHDKYEKQDDTAQSEYERAVVDPSSFLRPSSLL